MNSNDESNDVIRDLLRGDKLPDLGDIKPIFFPGAMLCTPSIVAAQRQGLDIHSLLARHLTGDWGDIDAEGRKQNKEALETGYRLFSAYNIPRSYNGRDHQVWIISDPSEIPKHYRVTTVLSPSDY